MSGCRAGRRRATSALANLPVVAAALIALLPQGASISDKEKACPVRDPYSVEESPFGWPLTPNDWTWARPDCWEKAHLICGGHRQSPLDINVDLPTCSKPTAQGPDGVLAKPDVASYKSADVDSVHICKYMGSASVHGHFGHLNLRRGSRTVAFEAHEVHVVTPSIHAINGEYFDAELMIFHKAHGAKDMLSEGVIVSVMYRHSDSTPSKLFEAMGFPAAVFGNQKLRLAPSWEPHSPAVDLPAEIRPALRGASYLYNGSVPVPPCTENVKWFVLGAPLPVTKAQTGSLAEHLMRHGNGVRHRPAQSRDRHGSGGACREVAVNSLQVGGNHEDVTCQAAKDAGVGLKSARCWDLVDPCFNKRYSAVDIITTDAISLKDGQANVHHGEKIVHYRPVTTVEVGSSHYSLDAWVSLDDIMLDDGHGNFGHLLLNGHIFFARSIAFKPVSQHTVDGKHYAAELQIEHVLFGDTFGKGLPGYHRELHKVMVSIFLKLGRENSLLRALEVFKNKHSIRDKVPYRLKNIDLDLSKELEPALSGPWYWYSSNSTRRGCGSSVRWMVFEEPLEVNLEQLNCLSMSVSGMDSSQVPRLVPKGHVWKEHLPTQAVELNETDCGFLPKTDWKYGQSHPHWDHGNERCWTTGYPICGNGRRQSPVDIPTSQLSKVGNHNFLAKCSWRPVARLNALNTGHNLQVNSNQMGYVTYVGKDGFPEYYHVVQFHIHMPSEHMIGGRQYAAELHVVHKRQVAIGHDKDDDLLVVAIMFDLGAENSTLLEQLFLPGAEQVLQQVGSNPKTVLAGGAVVDEVDERAQIPRPVDLMRATGPVIEGPFYRYDGSLTTPPCSEAVKWFVFGTPLAMSQAQWLSFKALYPNPENNRPIQPLNGREVSLNSFEEGELAKYDFYLNRHRGRDREMIQPSEGLIVVPIICTVILSMYVMASLFVREPRKQRSLNSGGLVDQLGKPTYEHLGDASP